jgi:sugar (pentulose or hexulose) kinase
MALFLGIELGSTRIKAVLIDGGFAPLASGAHTWENSFEDGYWTYGLDDALEGVRDAYAQMAAEYLAKTGKPLTKLDGMGVSAMMHGYLPFDKDDRQLAPFRTWRNTSTEQAAGILTKEFGFSIPQRWSIAHLYQAILNKEPHTREISFLTTLAGYVHWRLTGRKALGMNDASGMIPLDGGAYDGAMVSRFHEMTGVRLTDIVPEIIDAGECAGALTEEGARLLDPSGALLPGVPLCPPEGDAGTGMVATCGVRERTGNISAGTSVFAVFVLERALSKLYTEIDMMVTPAGKPAAAVHGNNGSTDLNGWVNLFAGVLSSVGAECGKSDLYEALFNEALKGEPDGGGLFACNYIAGEHITGFEEGRPLFARLPDSRFTLANFMRVQLYSAMAALKLGAGIITEREGVKLDVLTGHGGLFKTEKVMQSLMAGALGVPVAVMETAGEGGAWGIALLAAYMGSKEKGETLEDFLEERVFAKSVRTVIAPDPKDSEGFEKYIQLYKSGLEVERTAVERLTAR